MIVTKRWLNDFIDIEDIETEEICRVLNSIGLEVDSLFEARVPRGVVVAKVLECEKHPDADKLNICEVDLGKERKQIVCGAKNVAKGQFVPVATVGTDLGNGFVIKEAKLRGVDSHGMICSSNEIGLPKLNDGIWVLDESLGELKLGKELCEFELINDDIIEIELTANRGDCLSIYGVARDLSAALNTPLKKRSELSLQKVPFCNIDSKFDFDYQLAYTKISDQFTLESLIELRLGWIERFSKDKISNLLNYTRHSCGVLFRAYGADCAKVGLKVEDQLPKIYFDEKFVSVLGVEQTKESLPKGDEQEILVELSYVDPSYISKAVMGREIKKDELFYNSSRGSESDFEFGLSLLADMLNLGELNYDATKILEPFKDEIIISYKEINNLIGEEIEPKKIVQILEKLRFRVETDTDEIKVLIPRFRHDIQNSQDIVEEIVRMVGIENIPSKPLSIITKSIFNDTYKEYKKRDYFRKRASGVGFNETIGYLFDSKEDQKRFLQTTLSDDLDLLNPISSDLDTLRATLLLHLIRSASLNIKNGFKGVKLFEIGRVVNQNRDELQKMAFIASGERESESISNGGRPKQVDLIFFASLIGQVIGRFELIPSTQEIGIFNPFEIADIVKDGKKIGVLGSLHIDIEQEYDLPKSYVAEIDFESLLYERVQVKPYSKYPTLNRDLSLLKPKDLSFSTIKDAINELNIEELVKFYPIDLYRSDEMDNRESITIRFVLGSMNKTLEESEITEIVTKILEHLKKRFAMELR
jgi:phenylalanyl-tRNA synthetase beta chain